jgi:hypothetical protein
MKTLQNIILLMLLSLSAEVASQNVIKEFTYEDCKAFIEKESFKSKEGLIQLFYNVYQSDSINNIELTQKTIRLLQKKIKTYFPLKNCNRIVYSNSELTIRFNNNQKMTVPGTWGQATLFMSKEVVFVVKRGKYDSLTARFLLKKGHINILTSKLAKKLFSFVEDIYGT